MDPVMPFDACTIWCIYDFHKRKDTDVTKNLNIIKPYRETSAGIKDRAGFLFCQKCLFSQPISPH